MKIVRCSFYFVLALLTFSCGNSGTNPDPDLYEVSVSVAPDGAGTIAPAADSSYDKGSKVNLHANPNDGYRFTGWTGDVESTANPLSLTVDQDYKLTAKFTEGKKLFYLHQNGVTIMCPEAKPGQKGMVDGNEYMAVDRQMLETYEGAPRELCTSPVKNMAALYRGQEYLLIDISSWDVSNVVNMRGMFDGAARGFDSDLSHWDVSNVTDMSYMFFWADYFDSDISGWDVSNVTDMSGMFAATSYFNADINEWDVSSVTDMSGMFEVSESFDRDLNDWDVSNVKDMSNMFSGSDLGDPTYFEGDISDWDVSSVTKMDSMFHLAINFNSDISDWNVSNVKDMSGMFRSAQSFNQDLNEWDVSSVIDMSGMFGESFHDDIGAESFNGDISSWNVRNVTDMNAMFDGAGSFNQDLSGWCVQNINEEPNVFSVGSALTEDHHPVWGSCLE